MVNLIFDYDGTIHDTIKIYGPAFQKAYQYLKDKNWIKEKKYTEEEISRWLGFTAKEMWDSFMPDLADKEKQFCSDMIGEEMIKLTYEGKALLYPHAKEVLQKLKKQGDNLILLSNCKKAYLNAHKEYFQLEQFFTAFYCAEDFGFKPKYEIFKAINKKYSGEFFIIGDRYQDIKIAEKHSLKSIGCQYGYGTSNELKGATYLIKDICEVLTIL